MTITSTVMEPATAIPNGKPPDRGPTPNTWHAPDDGRYVSIEEYWETYYDNGDASYEWNNGYLEAKPLTTKAQYTPFLWFLFLLKEYMATSEAGQMVGLETGFSMIVPDKKNPGALKKAVRKPDFAVVRHDNPVPWREDERSYHGTFDLCVESLSDSTQNEVQRDTVDKKDEYSFAGVQEYYILDPSDGHMHFYRRTSAGTYEEIAPDANGIIRSGILPGFQFRLTDLHTLPPLDEMALDDVYRGFVLPAYQAAEARADRYAAKLRALGVDPEAE